MSVRPNLSRAADRPAPPRAEALESRVLLSGVPADVAGKLDVHLHRLSADVTAGRGNAFLQAKRAKADAAKRVESYVHTTAAPSAVLPALRRLGVEVTAVDARGKIVQGWVPADKVDAVARIAGVRHVGLPDYAVANAVTSAGDAQLNAAAARSRFASLGLTGAGVKVGVISDGVKDRASVGTELPPITIQPSGPGKNKFFVGDGNEGTAMLEIVHDLAPGAQLYFSAPGTSVEMANAIEWFVGQGCDVIVDDVTFFGEPWFADGSLAAAVGSAVDQGLVYVTSAGNYSHNHHYQAQYSPGPASGVNGGTWHAFDASGDVGNHVDVPPGATFRAYMQWSDPFAAATNDYDLYLYDAATGLPLNVQHGTNVQAGGGFAFEQVQYPNATGATVRVELRVNKKPTAAAREIEIFALYNTALEHRTADDAVIEHAAVERVMTIAAANATFNGSRPTNVAPYSSRGGSSSYTNFPLQQKTIRQTVDGTAVDGVQTQIGVSNVWPHNPFYGTSAAAPHAAAIATLLLQAKPSLTPAQVADVMAATATDLLAPGYDTASGAGLYDALGAVYALQSAGATDLATASDSGTSSTDNLTNVATPTFTGVAPPGSYVRLFVDGVERGGVQLAANQTAYAVQPATPLADGAHAVTVRFGADAASVPAAWSAESPALAVAIDATPPAVTAAAVAVAAPGGHRLTFTFSENVLASVDAADLTLASLPTVGFAAPPVIEPVASALPPNRAAFTFPAFAAGLLPDGNYRAMLSAAGVTDAAGNALAAAGATTGFFVFRGDATGDRTVDFDDLLALAQHYNVTDGTRGWAQGDFTADGNVDFDDLLLLAQRYNTTLPEPAAEPAAAAAVVSFEGGAAYASAGPVTLPTASPSTRKRDDAVFNAVTPIRKPEPVRPPARPQRG